MRSQPTEDHNMEDVMDATMDYNPTAQHIPQVTHQRYDAPVANNPNNTTSESWPAFPAHLPTFAWCPVLTEMDRRYEQMRAVVATAAQPREPIRDIPVKVHIRRPDKDSWAYMGRGVVSQEVTGQSSRVGARPSPRLATAPPHAFLNCLVY